MSEYQPEPPGGEPVEPPPRGGFPPPPQYPGYQTGPTSQQHPGPAPGPYPGPQPHPGAQPYPGPQSGPTPAQHPGQYGQGQPQYPGPYGQSPQQPPGQTPQQYPGSAEQGQPQYPGPYGQSPQQPPGQYGQDPEQYPGPAGQGPSQYPGWYGQEPQQHPGQYGPGSSQYPGPYGGDPQSYPGQYGQGAGGYPGQYPQQPYPAQDTGYPTQSLPPGAGYGPYQPDYLVGGPGVPSPRRRRRALWILVAAATVVVLGGGSVAAYTLLSGSGTTLDTKVPADTVAYAEVNLDPPAGQKVEAFRFLKHFPSVTIREDADTLLDGLVDEIFPDPEDRQKFVRNVQPWLGRHVAVAADPQGDQARPVFVAEVKDADTARSGLDSLAKEQTFGYVLGDGTVTVAETPEIAQQAVSDATKSALSGNDTYRGDVKAVGGDGGVVTVWANVAEAARLMPGGQSSPNANLDALTGRLAASLRFTDSVADLTVKAFGAQAQPSGPIGDRVGKLPDDTAVAVGISGGDQAVRRAYESLQKAGLAEQLDAELSKYDLRLPDDLAVLIGSQTVLAVSGDAPTPQVGVLTKTSDPARAKEVAQQLLDQVDSDVEIVQQQTAEGLALANSQEYLTRLLSGQGSLANGELYRKAVPDAGSSQYVVYVDMQRTLALSDDSDVPADAKALRAIGMTATTSGSTTTMHLRVVVG